MPFSSIVLTSDASVYLNGGRVNFCSLLSEIRSTTSPSFKGGKSFAKSRAQTLADEFRRLSMVRIKAFHGVKTMLRELRKVGGVYLLSNAQACFTRKELADTGLISLFDGIIISSEVGVKKPSERVFEIAFDTFGISPADSIYVGNDMRDDILGASSVGMKSAYIHTEQSGSYDYRLPTPDYIAKNHFELKRILLSLA